MHASSIDRTSSSTLSGALPIRSALHARKSIDLTRMFSAHLSLNLEQFAGCVKKNLLEKAEIQRGINLVLIMLFQSVGLEK